MIYCWEDLYGQGGQQSQDQILTPVSRHPTTFPAEDLAFCGEISAIVRTVMASTGQVPPRGDIHPMARIAAGLVVKVLSHVSTRPQSGPGQRVSSCLEGGWHVQKTLAVVKNKL
jgi:hypothetical protein